MLNSISKIKKKKLELEEELDLVKARHQAEV